MSDDLESARPGRPRIVGGKEGVHVRTEGPGGSIVVTNTLSTPALVTILIALFVSAIMSAVSIGLAINARDSAQLAEREARLAQARYTEQQIEVGILKDRGLYT